MEFLSTVYILSLPLISGFGSKNVMFVREAYDILTMYILYFLFLFLSCILLYIWVCFHSNLIKIFLSLTITEFVIPHLLCLVVHFVFPISNKLPSHHSSSRLSTYPVKCPRPSNKSLVPHSIPCPSSHLSTPNVPHNKLQFTLHQHHSL